MTSVSFIMPVRNEEEYIRASLQSLMEQSYPASGCEIIVVDGRSSDRTREIVEEICERNPQVRCLDNPAGVVPTAMNIGIRGARGEVIIRADGHNVYPRDYAANCVKYLEKTGAENVSFGPHSCFCPLIIDVPCPPTTWKTLLHERNGGRSV